VLKRVISSTLHMTFKSFTERLDFLVHTHTHHPHHTTPNTYTHLYVRGSPIIYCECTCKISNVCIWHFSDPNTFSFLCLDLKSKYGLINNSLHELAYSCGLIAFQFAAIQCLIFYSNSNK